LITIADCQSSHHRPDISSATQAPRSGFQNLRHSGGECEMSVSIKFHLIHQSVSTLLTVLNGRASHIHNAVHHYGNSAEN